MTTNKPLNVGAWNTGWYTNTFMNSRLEQFRIQKSGHWLIHALWPWSIFWAHSFSSTTPWTKWCVLLTEMSTLHLISVCVCGKQWACNTTNLWDCVTNEMAIIQSHRLHMGMPCWNTRDWMYGYVHFPSLKLPLKKKKTQQQLSFQLNYIINKDT